MPILRLPCALELKQDRAKACSLARKHRTSVAMCRELVGILEPELFWLDQGSTFGNIVVRGIA